LSDERHEIKIDEGMSEDKIKDVSAQETTRTNELAKYKAATADRMSTAAISIGFFSPAAAIILNPAPMTGIDGGRALLLAFATCNWFVLFFSP
jgi:hypothetical protein